MIQCRSRYELLKKGKAKEVAFVDEGRSPRPPNDERDAQEQSPEATRPTPRKRGSAKGKGKQPVTPLPEGDPTHAEENSTRAPPKRSRGRPRKAAQTRDDIPRKPEDAGSNGGRERPAPRKRGRPPRVKPRESPSTTEGPEAEVEQNA